MQCTLYGVQHSLQMLPKVLGKKAQDEKAALLERNVFAAVPTVCFGLRVLDFFRPSTFGLRIC